MLTVHNGDRRLGLIKSSHLVLLVSMKTNNSHAFVSISHLCLEKVGSFAFLHRRNCGNDSNDVGSLWSSVTDRIELFPLASHTLSLMYNARIV